MLFIVLKYSNNPPSKLELNILDRNTTNVVIDARSKTEINKKLTKIKIYLVFEGERSYIDL